MAKRALTYTVTIQGLDATLDRFKELPAEATTQLRKAAGQIADGLAKTATAAGEAAGGQAALEARTVKVKKDRFPSVQAGGNRGLGRYRKPAYKLLFGSEFGMDEHSGWYGEPQYDESRGFQYHPHTGQDGAWFFPSVEAEAPRISQEWDSAANGIADFFGAGG